MEYQIILFYKYIRINNPEELVAWHKEFGMAHGLRGRIIIANEGINGTLEGSKENVEKYIKEFTRDKRFKDIVFKRDPGIGNAFPKWSVKLRPEIVSLRLGEDDLDPNKITGTHISPEELQKLYDSGEEFYVVDMRNDYEYKVGHFENSILPSMEAFRELPKIISEIEHLRDKKIVTVCTGGVRCEKASGYLVKKGFKNVNQLDGGIVSYMKKFPAQRWKGKLYVFDGRIVEGYGSDEVISKCVSCNNPSDNYIDCAYIHCKGYRHIIMCKDCYDKELNLPFCSEDCRNKYVEEIVSEEIETN